MSLHLRGSNPCRLLPGETPTSSSQGRTGQSDPWEVYFNSNSDQGLWLQWEFLTREDLGLSQECGILWETHRTPPSLLRLLKLFSHSRYVSWCNKAYPLPEAKPTQPTGLAGHAHLFSSINRFKQALFRSEPWNTLWVPLTMLAPMHRLKERKWLKHQPANW